MVDLMMIGFIQAMSQDYDGRDDHDITIHPWIGTLAHMEGIFKISYFIFSFIISLFKTIISIIISIIYFSNHNSVLFYQFI